jgi:hypothetical protein
MKKPISGSAIKHLVPNNPQADLQLTGGKNWDDKAEARAKKQTLYDSSYKTAAGHWKRRDEPGEPRRTEYLKIDPDALRKQKQWDARQRLKKKDAVPTKQGKKLFDQFMKEANTYRSKSISKKSKTGIKDLDALENLYNAASGLTFQQWLILVADLSKDSASMMRSQGK